MSRLCDDAATSLNKNKQTNKKSIISNKERRDGQGNSNVFSYQDATKLQ